MPKGLQRKVVHSSRNKCSKGLFFLQINTNEVLKNTNSNVFSDKEDAENLNKTGFQCARDIKFDNGILLINKSRKFPFEVIA
jgi:hypothetical protein